MQCTEKGDGSLFSRSPFVEKRLPSPLSTAGEQEEQRLLRVEPILRLVEDDRGRTVHHLVRHLVAAVSGQAVHEQGVGSGVRHQRRIRPGKAGRRHAAAPSPTPGPWTSTRPCRPHRRSSRLPPDPTAPRGARRNGPRARLRDRPTRGARTRVARPHGPSTPRASTRGRARWPRCCHRRRTPGCGRPATPRFGKRQRVGQGLARMLFVGERVDDVQARRRAGEPHELRLLERADDDGRHPALEVVRHVFDRLARSRAARPEAAR